MNHLGTKTLESGRLLLRRFGAEDAEAIFYNWASDPEVARYLTWPHHKSIGESETILKEWLSRYHEANFYQWAITIKDNGDLPIGSIGTAKNDDLTKMVHIGYCIGQRWWRKGITTEALSLLIAYFFNEVKVNRIESRHDPKNPNSGNVMAKCGMKYEGTHRAADWNNQGICDTAYYAILANDYFAAPVLE